MRTSEPAYPLLKTAKEAASVASELARQLADMAESDEEQEKLRTLSSHVALKVFAIQDHLRGHARGDPLRLAQAAIESALHGFHEANVRMLRATDRSRRILPQDAGDMPRKPRDLAGSEIA